MYAASRPTRRVARFSAFVERGWQSELCEWVPVRLPTGLVLSQTVPLSLLQVARRCANRAGQRQEYRLTGCPCPTTTRRTL